MARDGQVRSAKILTWNGILKRLVAKLAILDVAPPKESVLKKLCTSSENEGVSLFGRLLLFLTRTDSPTLNVLFRLGFLIFFSQFPLLIQLTRVQKCLLVSYQLSSVLSDYILCLPVKGGQPCFPILGIWLFQGVGYENARPVHLRYCEGKRHF